MFDPKEFTTTAAKPLMVILLLDVSYSMNGNKIDSLNKAVEEMITKFGEEEIMATEIQVSIITFGGEANLILPYTRASQVKFYPLTVKGNTPMGEAFKMAKGMIEDKNTTPSRAYRPVVILVSDGQPTDMNWENDLNEFTQQGRSSKCDRMALSIGSNDGTAALTQFIEGTEHQLFTSKNASELYQFFTYVTMSVTTRSRGNNPNVVPKKESIEVPKVKEVVGKDIW